MGEGTVTRLAPLHQQDSLAVTNCLCRGVASDLLLERNMQTFERYLKRWRDAGLIDDATESSIRIFEAGDARPSGRRWQVILALVLGGILLGAGVLLFVAANWDDVSPGWRLTLVLAMLALFHGAGIVAKERFSGFSTTMHALGTIAAGAAIALVGQIFNMQEHWPAAVMLWALCAAAGWWLLRDSFQETLTLLLVPAWLISEWMDRASVYQGAEVYLARMIAVLAAVYLTAFLHSHKRVVFGILFGVSAVVLCICVGALSEGWSYYHFGFQWGFLPLPLRVGRLHNLAPYCGIWMARRQTKRGSRGCRGSNGFCVAMGAACFFLRLQRADMETL